MPARAVGGTLIVSLMRIRRFLSDSSYPVHKIQGTRTSAGGSAGWMPHGRTPLSQQLFALIRL